MSNSHQQSASLSSFSSPSSGYVTPVACQHCGAAAHLIELMPHPKQLNAELRVFECADCGKQTELIVI